MAKKTKTLAPRGKSLRSQLWFDNPDNPGMTALYLERYLNYGLTGPELRSGKPIIGIAQTGSDLSPCNRHHLELAKRVREGIRDAGGAGRRNEPHGQRDGESDRGHEGRLRWCHGEGPVSEFFSAIPSPATQVCNRDRATRHHNAVLE